MYRLKSRYKVRKFKHLDEHCNPCLSTNKFEVGEEKGALVGNIVECGTIIYMKNKRKNLFGVLGPARDLQTWACQGKENKNQKTKYYLYTICAISLVL